MKNILASLILMVPSIGSAQGLCIEPYKPDRDFLSDGGFSALEMREEYQRYFSETEAYLNCMNLVAANVRREARAAVQEYNQILNDHPLRSDDIIRNQTQEPDWEDTGSIFLGYTADWLR